MFKNDHKNNFRFAINQERGWYTRNFTYITGEFRTITRWHFQKLNSGNNSIHKLTTVWLFDLSYFVSFKSSTWTNWNYTLDLFQIKRFKQQYYSYYGNFIVFVHLNSTKRTKKQLYWTKHLLKVLDTKTTNQFEHIGFHKFELNFYPTKSVPTKF